MAVYMGTKAPDDFLANSRCCIKKNPCHIPNSVMDG